MDYRTFLRTYYNEERHRIYQIGVHWIFRGLTQLILYRIVYYYLSMAPAEVDDSGDLVRFVVSGFLLYLRISGQFHVIVGILRLFGFNLPETHHLYSPVDELQRLLAEDQHLLERLHGDDLLLPVVPRAAQARRDDGAPDIDGAGVPGHVGAPRLSVVLDTWVVSLRLERRALLDDARRPRDGEHAARGQAWQGASGERADMDAAARRGRRGANGRNVRRHRVALVALDQRLGERVAHGVAGGTESPHRGGPSAPGRCRARGGRFRRRDNLVRGA